MISFSEKAWKAYESSSSPKYYYDVKQYKDYLEIGQPPFTPALTTMFALQYSLNRMIEEGIENIFEKHSEIAKFTRTKANDIGLQILPKEEFASDTVTAIKLPENIDGKKLVNEIKENYNIVLGGGQQKLAGKIVRIGHMGWVEKKDIEDSINALKETLGKRN
jgi:aspartate aminotransferase-like enzyme